MLLGKFHIDDSDAARMYAEGVKYIITYTCTYKLGWKIDKDRKDFYYGCPLTVIPNHLVKRGTFKTVKTEAEVNQLIGWKMLIEE